MLGVCLGLAVLGAPQAVVEGERPGARRTVERLDRKHLFTHETGRGWPFGSAVCGVGDVDGDGVPDVAVSTPEDPGVELDAGRVEILSGRALARDEDVAVRSWSGESRGELFGFALVAADLDGDATLEIVVGTPGPRAGSGLVQVFSTRSGDELLRLESGGANDDFGWSVAAGDLGADGVPEIVVGAPRALDRIGGAWIWSARGELLQVLTGDAADARFGWCVVAGADLDGDGRGDVVVGAAGDRTSSRVGSVHVVSLDRGRLVRVEGEQPIERFGSALAVLGDADGDGRPDLAVGAPAHRATHVGEGRVVVLSSASWTPVRVLSGHREGSSFRSRCSGCSTGMRFGHALVALPDVDGDGLSELVVSAPGGFSGYGSTTGWIGRIDGRTGERTYLAQGSPFWFCGTAMAPAGDVDGDGRTDLVVGIPGDGSMMDSAVSLVSPLGPCLGKATRELGAGR